jgi:hypothetical protein
MARYSPFLVAVASIAGCNALVGVGDLTLEAPDATFDASAFDVATPPSPEADASVESEADVAPGDATVSPLEADVESPRDAAEGAAPDVGPSDGEEPVETDGSDGGGLDGGLDASDAAALPDVAPEAMPTLDAASDGDEAQDAVDADDAG